MVQQIDVPVSLKNLIGDSANPDGRVTAPPSGAQFRFDVAIVGLGYVGLPTALSFCAAGARVLGVDISDRRREVVLSGRADLLPRDQERLTGALAARTLCVSGEVGLLREAAAVIICVPTPVDRHLVPDLDPLKAACATVVREAVDGQVLVLTSTTYVGTTRDLLARPLEARGLVAGNDVFVAFSPERINPGDSSVPQEQVPRVLGGLTPACARRAHEVLAIYAGAVHVVSSAEAAELTKLYENTFRAVNIALANELADVSRLLDVEVMEVITAASTKPYGFMPFTPGPGVGGHCIPCDSHYLLWQLKRRRGMAPLIEQAMSSIAQRPLRVLDRVRDVLSEAGRAVRGSRILVVGVTYKPGVEDIRESPALEIIDLLLECGATVDYADPLVPCLVAGDGSTLTSVGEAPAGSYDLVLLITLHPGTDYDWAASHPLVLDTTYQFAQAPHRAVL
jgi:nucleotide sugar dehydrogenase